MMRKFLLSMIISGIFFTANSQTLLDTALNFTVKDVSGNTWQLFSILDQDKIVVIDFFSTACGTCQLYAPDVQAAYEAFGENQGNVFFMGIDKGNTNANVQYFDSAYGITYPDVSGTEGGGNAVHIAYQIQGTPTLAVILPDRSIPVKQIYPPSTENLIDSITSVGGDLWTSAGPKTVNEPALSISPNPATSFLNIAVTTKSESVVNVEIYNLLGVRVFETGNVKVSQDNYSKKIDLSELKRGPYFIRLVENGKQVVIKKLILK